MGDRRGSAGKDSLDRRGGRRISILASRTLRLRVAQRNEQQTAMLQNRLRRITSAACQVGFAAFDLLSTIRYAIGARRSDQFVELKAQQAMSMGAKHG